MRGGEGGGPPLYRQTDSIMTVEGTEPPACQTVSSWTCNHLQCTLKESPREIMPRTLQNRFLNSRRIKYKKCLQENPYICILLICILLIHKLFSYSAHTVIYRLQFGRRQPTVSSVQMFTVRQILRVKIIRY